MDLLQTGTLEKELFIIMIFDKSKYCLDEKIMYDVLGIFTQLYRFVIMLFKNKFYEVELNRNSEICHVRPIEEY